MKTIKIGIVKIKVNDKGQARESYPVTTWNHEKNELVNTGEFKTRDIYTMPYQTKNKLFKTKNNCFNPETCEAHSYNWWKYVSKIKGKIVFNNHNYSMTTNKHQSEMRRLLDQLGIKVFLYVDMHDSLTSFESKALISMYKKLFNLELKLTKGKKDLQKTRLNEIKNIKLDIKKARSLGAKLSKSEIKELKDIVLKNENYRLEKLAETRLKKKTETQATGELEKSGQVFNESMLAS